MAEASRNMDERRRQAKEAMEGPERAERRKQKETRLETKRKQAALSMEGPEQKARRLAREKKIKEKEETSRATEETKKKASQLEELRRQEKEELAKTEEERREQAEQARLEEMRQSEETITAIRSKPVSMRSIRTFKSDIARALKGGASETSIAMAEDKKRRMAIPIKKEGGYKWLKIIISVFAFLFVVGGSGLLIYVFVLLPKKEPPITPIENPVISSIITVEKNEKIDTTTLSSETLRQSLIGRNIPTLATVQDLEQIYFVEQRENEEKRLTAFDLIEKIEWKMPSILLRSMEKEFMYGINRSASPSSFIIFQTASPQNAFSGMLAWEKGMAADLYALINGQNPPPELLRQKFDDRLIRNIDTRALIGPTGEILFLYSVIDNKKVIIIAKDEKVFTELLSRL